METVNIKKIHADGYFLPQGAFGNDLLGYSEETLDTILLKLKVRNSGVHCL
mgnify:CR=1 FL=1